MQTKILFVAAQLLSACCASSTFASPGLEASDLLSKRIADCVGSFQAAKGPGSYVEGFKDATTYSETALKELLPLIGVSDPKPYLENINQARDNFGIVIISEPLSSRAKILQLIKDCSIYVSQAKSFRERLRAREEQALAERAAEQNVRLQAEKDAREEQYRRDRLALETEKAKAEIELLRQKDSLEAKRLTRLALETEKAKAEAAIRLAEVSKSAKNSTPQHKGEVPSPTLASYNETSHAKNAEVTRIDYVHYPDNSCGPSDQRRCVSENEMAKLCSVTNNYKEELPRQVGVIYPIIRTLIKNQGQNAVRKTDISVVGGVCTFSFRVTGSVQGTAYDKSLSCRVSRIADNGKGQKNSKSIADIMIDTCTEN